MTLTWPLNGCIKYGLSMHLNASVREIGYLKQRNLAPMVDCVAFCFVFQLGHVQRDAVGFFN